MRGLLMRLKKIKNSGVSMKFEEILSNLNGKLERYNEEIF